MLADGKTTAPIMGVGTIRIILTNKMVIEIEEVLYVPELSACLFSVKQHIQQAQCRLYGLNNTLYLIFPHFHIKANMANEIFFSFNPTTLTPHYSTTNQAHSNRTSILSRRVQFKSPDMATLRNQSAQYVQQATSALPLQLVMTNGTDTVVPQHLSTKTKSSLHTPTKLPPNKQQAPHTTTTDIKIPPQPILKSTRTELASNKSTLAQTSSSGYIHNTDKDVRLPHTPDHTPYPPQTSQILAPTRFPTKTPSDSAPSPSLSEFRLNNSKSPTFNNYYDILPDEGEHFTFSPAPPPIPHQLKFNVPLTRKYLPRNLSLQIIPLNILLCL